MGKALGLIEFIGYVPAICAADAALKAASVDLIGIEKVTGGIVTVKITGDVDAVQASVESAKNYASKIGNLIGAHVIPRLCDEAEDLLINSKNLKEDNIKKEKDSKEKIKDNLKKTTIGDTKILKKDIKDTYENLGNYPEKVENRSLLDGIEDLGVSKDEKGFENSTKRNKPIEDRLEESKEVKSLDVKEASKIGVKELRKKIKALNTNIAPNKIKSLKKKDLVEILLEYNKEGDK